MILALNILGGKNYGELKEERIRNDDIIKNSVKCLNNAVLLTDDRNLLVRFLRLSKKLKKI